MRTANFFQYRGTFYEYSKWVFSEFDRKRFASFCKLGIGCAHFSIGLLCSTFGHRLPPYVNFFDDVYRGELLLVAFRQFICRVHRDFRFGLDRTILWASRRRKKTIIFERSTVFIDWTSMGI